MDGNPYTESRPAGLRRHLQGVSTAREMLLNGVGFVSDQIRGGAMVLLEFSMFPIGKGESVSEYVAKSLEIIDSSGLDYHCHAMGTVIEGQYDQVMDVVKRCFDAMAARCARVECSIKLDYRQAASGRLRAKVASVEEKLGRKLK
jgi:uncharacterized protein (TIGR00106 family)